MDHTARETIRDHQIKLTDAGHKQAEYAGQQIAAEMAWLPNKSLVNYSSPYWQPRKIRAYVSPFARTRETFAGIRKAIEPELDLVREDPRLREQEWGHLRPTAESLKIDKDRIEHSPFYYRIPDGESGADVYDRCTGFLDTLFRDFEKPDYPLAALIVGHGFSIRILLMRWLHWSVEELEAKRNLRNCEVLQLGLGENGKYSLVTPLEDRVDQKTS